METLYRDYAPKNVRFFYIYKALAHPETNGYVAPYSLEERLRHVKEAERRLGSEIPWLCDAMSNDAKHALGNAPNSEFIIDPEGKIAVSRSWSNPAELRRDLERLVGPVERPTAVADLDLNTIPPPKAAASGLVPRVQAPNGMRPLAIEPKESTQPYYAKLRVEVEEAVLRGGAGKMCVGFHLDPLYDVHWNNLAAPLRFELTSADSVRLSPATGQGPKIEEPADIDPREFLVDVEGATPGATIELTVQYYACNDAAGWCKLVSQGYAIHFRTDPDAGRVQLRNRPDRTPRGAPFPAQGLPPKFPPGGKPPRGNFLMGLIVAVDATRGVLTIRTRDRGPAQYRVTDETIIMTRGGRAALGDLHPPQRAMFELANSADPDAAPVIRRLRFEATAAGRE